MHSVTTQFSSVQLLTLVWLFTTPWTELYQASLSITSSWTLLKLMSIESVMPPNHLILGHPFLLLPSVFPSVRLCIHICSYVCVSVCSHSQLFATPWSVARQASLSTEFSRQEDWSGLSFPPPEDLSNLGIEPVSLPSSALAGGFFTTVSPGKYVYTHTHTRTHTHIVIDYYSTIKINEILPFEITWIDLESIMLNEIRQTEKDKYCLLSHLCGI